MSKLTQTKQSQHQVSQEPDIEPRFDDRYRGLEECIKFKRQKKDKNVYQVYMAEMRESLQTSPPCGTQLANIQQDNSLSGEFEKPKSEHSPNKPIGMGLFCVQLIWNPSK